MWLSYRGYLPDPLIIMYCRIRVILAVLVHLLVYISFQYMDEKLSLLNIQKQ